MSPRMAPTAQREVDPAEVQLVEDEADIQLKAKRGGAAKDVELAYGGLRGEGEQLPHLDRIQRSFGEHDVSGVRAHRGAEAEEACDQMGAEAYATGNQVAFGKEPDLHTAAHEAAHTVQQRAGVHPKGAGGDEALERSADQVADKVVAGEPADYLLSQIARPGQAEAQGGAVQMKKKLPAGEDAFEGMWDAHPHNHQDDESENTSSPEVLEEHGLPAEYENTCAIRISIMLNNIGETITQSKAAAAGIKKGRLHYSRKTKQNYILSAKEMWTYLSMHFRSADVTFPKGGKRYKDQEEFDAAFAEEIQPTLAGGKGIVAFDKIFSYGGTGHVDLFDGESLSNAASWYPCQRLMLWYIVVP